MFLIFLPPVKREISKLTKSNRRDSGLLVVGQRLGVLEGAHPAVTESFLGAHTVPGPRNTLQGRTQGLRDGETFQTHPAGWREGRAIMQLLAPASPPWLLGYSGKLQDRQVSQRAARNPQCRACVLLQEGLGIREGQEEPWRRGLGELGPQLTPPSLGW